MRTREELITMERPLAPADRLARRLAAVPDAVADYCAACGGAFNRPLGSNVARCLPCISRDLPLVEDAEERALKAEDAAECTRDENQALEHQAGVREKHVARLEDRIHDLEQVLRDVARAFETDDPLARMLGAEVRERTLEILAGSR